MRLTLSALIAFFLLLVAAIGQPRPPGYDRAAEVFHQFDIDSRLRFQIFLIAAGYWNAVPNEQFNGRIFAAIRRLQSDKGTASDGVITADLVEYLIGLGRPMLTKWGFRLVKHPNHPRSIWIPIGLGLIGKKTPSGINFEDPQDRLGVSFNFFPGIEAGDLYRAMTGKFQSDGAKLHFKTFKDDWFVISVTLTDGTDGYLRYHTDGAGVFGFSTWWKNANGNVAGERVATLMSASLWSEMTGARFLPPPAPVPAPQEPPAVPPSEPRERGPNPKGEPETVISMGTGFFVTAQGHVVTNHHVIEGCHTTAIKTDSGETDVNAVVVGSDRLNDLALIRTTLTNPKFARLRKTVRLGEPIAVFGYPHADILASSGNFTLGHVSALAGVMNNTGHFQMTAPIQKGNSGGPVLDHAGNVVGVATSTIKASSEMGTPQNVNFAVRASLLSSFLDAHQISHIEGGLDATLSTIDLAEASKAISAFVLCLKRKSN